MPISSMGSRLSGARAGADAPHCPGQVNMSYPLITHARADSVFAWRSGCPITAGRFLADALALARLLPAGMHMLNVCTDRYRFAVGLAAALLTGKVSLLPPAHTPEMVRQMVQFAPDTFCLTDVDDHPIALPQLQFPDFPESADTQSVYNPPLVDAGQLAACVFTSGSTGMPLPHRKTWGALVRNVRSGARLSGLDDGCSHAVIGTVPPQHMYGLEATVVAVMQNANAMVVGQSFYPADIAAAIESAPRPRVLVSTPLHMKALLQAQASNARLDRIFSATAPLSQALAAQLEAHFSAPLLEIYGSTETGQVAMRSTAGEQEWQLFPDLVLELGDDGRAWIRGGHVEQPTTMGDVIEPVDAQRFLLHGRSADLVNIAGKRNSLSYLNLQLTAIEGVVDGAFHMPDEMHADSITRLSAFVVAPGLTAAAIMAALRERIDPVFLPRPLVFVDALPRNATGKLPREALMRLAALTKGGPA